MKKILALVLALPLALSLAACGGKDNPKPSGNDKPGTSQQEQQPGSTPDQQEQTDDKGGTTTGWPTDGYGALIPEPDWNYEIYQNDEYRFIVTYDEMSVDDLKPYTEKLKEAGFDNNIDERGEGSTWAWLGVNMDEDMKVQVEDGRILLEP